jgi:hypothetical protein
MSVKRVSREQPGAELAPRLRRRRGEIEQAILTRVYNVSEPPRGGGPEYAEGLRDAVAAGIDYGIAAIEHGERGAPPIPDALLAQARLAARSGVNLDTVLRRYFAGHALLEDFLVDEAERAEPLEPTALKRLLRSQASLVDGLLAAVSEAHAREADRRPRGTDARRALQIERLLAGELPDVSELGYDFAADHLGVLARGAEAAEALREAARDLDRRLLCLPREDGSLWAWLGGREALDPRELAERLAARAPARGAFALGEPAQGLGGWRLTHQQARAALRVALRGPEPAIVRYGEVALLASVLQDDLAMASLRRLFLEPLEGERDGGWALRQTLRAYFDVERNVSSTAARLGVSWQTVKSRLEAVERLIGSPIAERGAELELALALADDFHRSEPP